MIHVFGVLLNSKINKVMVRKKKEEEQPVTAEVVETKKKSSKKRMIQLHILNVYMIHRIY